MRISMWVLAQRLDKYEKTIQIREGKRILRNARIFADELHISDYTVYVSRPQPERVLLSNGADCIILRADNVNDVFNDILDIFELCGNISGEAYDLIASGCSAKELLEKGTVLLGRALILADATFYMRETADVNAYLHSRTEDLEAEEHILPLDALLSISTLPQIRVSGLPTYSLEPAGAERPAAVSNLFVRGIHQGWLISVGGKEALDRGMLDLQDGFAELVTAWLERRGDEAERTERAGIFSLLLERGKAGAAEAELCLRAFGWYPGDKKQVYAIGQLGSGPDQTALLERQLEKLGVGTFSFRMGEQLYYIINHAVTPPQYIEQGLCETLKRCGCAAGKSTVFSDLEQLEYCCRTAAVAFRFVGQTPGRVLEYSEAVLPYIAELLRERSGGVELRSEALTVLSEYDAAHEGGMLKKTLAEYLKQECSCTAAAQALFIHRSTFLYRLSRITQLTGLDLENPQTRLHLRISFLMEEKT